VFSVRGRCRRFITYGTPLTGTRDVGTWSGRPTSAVSQCRQCDECRQCSAVEISSSSVGGGCRAVQRLKN
jgi:hypothetical protein